MAKIFYFVSGEGLGHATRSIPIIEFLKKNHYVVPISSNRAYHILSKKIPNTLNVSDLELIYENNRINIYQTLKINFLKLKQLFTSYKKIRYLMKKEKPDIIISDFCFWPKIFSIFHRKNYFTIDNNHLCVKIKGKKYDWFSWIKTWIYIKLFISNHKLNVIPAVCQVKTKYKTLLINPILRKEIINLRKEIDNKKIKQKEHILVYQTSSSYPNLIKKLNKLNQKFIIYGLDKLDKRKNMRLNISENPNLIFKRFNETEFFNDLASSKAVLTNGGFSLISEAIYLNKPIFTVPIKNQYEQILNSILINKKRLGLYSKSINKKRFDKFLNQLDYIKKNQLDYNNYNPMTAFLTINKIINDFLNIKNTK